MKKDVAYPEFIEEVHRIITNGTLENDSYEGRFRDTDDIVISDRPWRRLPPTHSYST